MSSLSSYPTKAFKESQKFLVRDPSSGSTSFVLGSDLVSYITPRLNYVRSQSTRLAAENTDYEIGVIVQTSGSTEVNDGQSAVYLVVGEGEGSYPMLNGNELLLLEVGITPQTTITTLDDVSKIPTVETSALINLQQFNLKGYLSSSDAGGGVIFWDSGRPRSDHDGVTIFSPTVPWTTASDDYKAGAGETNPSGPGCFVRVIGGTFDVRESGETTLKLYVSPTGSGNGSGTSTANKLPSIQAALNKIYDLGSYIKGGVDINLEAGTYGLVSVKDSTRTSRGIDIKGPDVGGHPNVPTAIIDGTSDLGGRGLDSGRNNRVTLTDVKIQNLTSGTGVVTGTGCQVSLVNVHTFDVKYVLSTLNGSFTSVYGGLWDGNNIADSIGYRSFYNSVHEMTQPAPEHADGALLIKNFDRGMLINEGVQGHIDFINIESCTTGINNKRGAGAVNTNQVKIDDCGVGVLNENNGWFNNGIRFGSVTPNTVNVRSLGGSPELIYLTSLNEAKTERMIQTSREPEFTGTTALTTVHVSSTVPDWVISEGGDSGRFIIYGSCSLAGPAQVQLVLDDGLTLDLQGAVSIPTGSTSFKVEFEMWHLSESSQRTLSAVVSDVGTNSDYRERSVPLRDTSFLYRLRIDLANSTDSVTFSSIKFYGTYGG